MQGYWFIQHHTIKSDWSDIEPVISAISLFFLSHCETFELSLFHATMVCFFHSFNAGSILINPSDLYPQSSGFVFGIMNTAGAIPGKFQDSNSVSAHYFY